MLTINRDAITVSAKKPLIDWINSLDPLHPMQYRDQSNYDESTIYLIEELDTEKDFNEWIRENYLEIFEQELFSWITDDSKWPNPLHYALFSEWIQVSYQSLVMDQCPEHPIEYDDDL